MLYLQVATMFHDATVGNSINIVLVRILIMEEEDVRCTLQTTYYIYIFYEPRCEKTGLQGFCPGLSQKMARSLNFQIYEGEEFYYPSSKNKGADQLCSCTKLICIFVFAQAKVWFSHDSTHMFKLGQ